MISKSYILTCDGCGVVFECWMKNCKSDKPKEQRRVAAENGWDRKKVIVGDELKKQDFCEKCVNSSDILVQ